jgi:hypothetical protein
MNFFKKTISKASIFIYSLFLPMVSLAECDPTAGRICNPVNANTIQEFIQVTLVGAIKIGMPIVALAIIYCGFLFVEARGNSEKLTKAKDSLMYTLIGAALLLGAWAIAQIISNTVFQLY